MDRRSDEADLLDRAGRLAGWRGEGGDARAFLDAQPDSWIVGTAAEAIDDPASWRRPASNGSWPSTS